MLLRYSIYVINILTHFLLMTNTNSSDTSILVSFQLIENRLIAENYAILFIINNKK